MRCDEERARCFARTCRAGGCGGNQGWRKVYERVSGGAQAFVCLYVIDRSERARYSTYLPFLVDTGTTVTIIPRPMLRDRGAFKSIRAYEPRVVHGVGGGTLSGSMFLAALSMSPLRDDCEPLHFLPDTKVFVADDATLAHGLLGLDALGKIVSIFDGTGVSFQAHQIARNAASAG